MRVLRPVGGSITGWGWPAKVVKPPASRRERRIHGAIQSARGYSVRRARRGERARWRHQIGRLVRAAGPPHGPRRAPCSQGKMGGWIAGTGFLESWVLGAWVIRAPLLPPPRARSEKIKIAATSHAAAALMGARRSRARRGGRSLPGGCRAARAVVAAGAAAIVAVPLGAREADDVGGGTMTQRTAQQRRQPAHVRGRRARACLPSPAPQTPGPQTRPPNAAARACS